MSPCPCRRWIVPLLLAALSCAGAAGCKNKKAADAEAIAVAAYDVTAIRARYQAANPGSRVGIVVAVKSEAQLAAVGDIPVQDFAIGDFLTFIDSREEPVATGRVINATPTELHLRYEKKKREPRVGDMAVRVAQ